LVLLNQIQFLDGTEQVSSVQLIRKARTNLGNGDDGELMLEEDAPSSLTLRFVFRRLGWLDCILQMQFGSGTHSRNSTGKEAEGKWRLAESKLRSKTLLPPLQCSKGSLLYQIKYPGNGLFSFLQPHLSLLILSLPLDLATRKQTLSHFLPPDSREQECLELSFYSDSTNLSPN